MEFVSPAEFRTLVRNADILRGFDVKWKNNEGCRIIILCKEEKCNWRCYGRWNRSRTKRHIMSLHHKHSCRRECTKIVKQIVIGLLPIGT